MILPAKQKRAVSPMHKTMDRDLALEVVRVTEETAIAASHQMGRGDEKMADKVAVDAMRWALNGLNIDGTVVIGEGERDQAPMLYIGEKVGSGDGPKVDIALDPLEGTTITARGGSNALSVIAMANQGGFLHAPDVYMEKIAIGAGYEEGIVDLDAPVSRNLAALAKAKDVAIHDLVVCILERPRHEQLIQEVRKAGARITLIADGDVSGVIATTQPQSGIDMYIGTGGAPEGVLAAAALRCIGGQMQGRLLINTKDEISRAEHCGLSDFKRIYTLDEMATGEVMFAATGVTDGAMLKGVRHQGGTVYTYSLVMRSKSGTVRYIEAQHNAGRKQQMRGKNI